MNLFPNKVFNRTLLAFVHIEKAAGTTLIHLLRLNFIGRYCDVRPLSKTSNRLFTAKDMKLVIMSNPFLTCIGGHAVKPFSDLDTLFPNIRYFTIFRDPIKRYVSQYRYWVEKLGRDISFEKFMEVRPSFNFQTRKIAGTVDIEKTRALLKEKLFLAGTVENFDSFLILLKKKIQPFRFNPYYQIVNESKSRIASAVSQEEIIDKYREQIISRNGKDIELYQYVASVIMPNEIKAYGPTFYNDLEAFQRVNRGYTQNLLRYIDYLLRKGLYEPLFGLIRKRGGLPYKGSY